MLLIIFCGVIFIAVLVYAFRKMAKDEGVTVTQSFENSIANSTNSPSDVNRKKNLRTIATRSLIIGFAAAGLDFVLRWELPVTVKAFYIFTTGIGIFSLYRSYRR